MKHTISNYVRATPDWAGLDQKKSSWLYKLVRWFVWLFSPKYQIVGLDKLPQEPCVIVGNHSHMYGPIAGEFYTPGKHYIWCAGEMMDKNEVSAYAYRDFWSLKPKGFHWFYRLLSYLITPIAMLIFCNAHTIPVYHDTRLITTFRESIKRLQEGNSLVIFPECYEEYNNIVHAFHSKFVDLARFYYKKTGLALRFVPLYIAPRLKTLFYGDPIVFRPDAPIEDERERICSALMEEITRIAQAQPLHTVVPYPNVSKKLYPKSKSSEEIHA